MCSKTQDNTRVSPKWGKVILSYIKTELFRCGYITDQNTTSDNYTYIYTHTYTHIHIQTLTLIHAYARPQTLTHFTHSSNRSKHPFIVLPIYLINQYSIMPVKYPRIIPNDIPLNCRCIHNLLKYHYKWLSLIGMTVVIIPLGQ